MHGDKSEDEGGDAEQAEEQADGEGGEYQGDATNRGLLGPASDSSDDEIDELPVRRVSFAAAQTDAEALEKKKNDREMPFVIRCPPSYIQLCRNVRRWCGAPIESDADADADEGSEEGSASRGSPGKLLFFHDLLMTEYFTNIRIIYNGIIMTTLAVLFRTMLDRIVACSSIHVKMNKADRSTSMVQLGRFAKHLLLLLCDIVDGEHGLPFARDDIGR